MPLRARLPSPLLLLAGISLIFYLPGQSSGQDADTFFENRIRPILAENCFKCHGGKATKGGVRLDQKDALFQKGEDGPLIIPGKPRLGRLMAAVRHTGKIKMPPKKKLLPAEIKALGEWISAGATWPKNTPGAKAQKHDPATHWAFQEIRDPEPPARSSEWAINPIDLFVSRRLESSGMTPSRPARRDKLLRRITFDLIGLTPSLHRHSFRNLFPHLYLPFCVFPGRHQTGFKKSRRNGINADSVGGPLNGELSGQID